MGRKHFTVRELMKIFWVHSNKDLRRTLKGSSVPTKLGRQGGLVDLFC